MAESKRSVGRPKDKPEYHVGKMAVRNFEKSIKKILSVSKEEILKAEKQISKKPD